MNSLSAPVLLVGHRASGKTTLGRLAADALGMPFVDLDLHIEQHTGRTCADLVAHDAPRFRSLERELLDDLLKAPSRPPPIIAPGAGLQPIPPQPWCLWIWRDGWQQTARQERQRLRPELDWDHEVSWMRSTREPRWARAAHLRLDVSRGRTAHQAAADLAGLLTLLAQAQGSPFARRSWSVPLDAADLPRAERDAAQLGFAGVELRDDLLGDAPATGPAALVSLRSHRVDWLRHLAGRATAFDVDRAFLPDLLDSRLLHELPPRRLILSSHPPELSAAEAAALHQDALRLRDALPPAWRPLLETKFAPPVADATELEPALQHASQARLPDQPATFLPQSARLSWIRPWLLGCHDNASNYLPTGLRPDLPHFPDLQRWLPSLAAPCPQRFEALLGDPVHGSRGDLWHRLAALATPGEEDCGYLKIPAATPEELDAILAFAASRGFRGLSVTSPLKRTVLQSPLVDNPLDLPAANTLAATTQGHWRAHDTDQEGMTGALTALQQAGITLGPVAIIGRGGVAPAVRRALEDHDGWTIALHVGARQGWPDDPAPVTLVVNAAGSRPASRRHPPPCQAWLDLHYVGVDPAPREVDVHRNGDAFFEAQARAQRALWKMNPGS